MFDMTGKAILWVGGAGYLGMPGCTLLRQLGADICIADIDPGRLASAETALRAVNGPGKVTSLTIDMGDEQAILGCVRGAAERLGGLWGIVNATAGSTAKRFDDLTAEDFDQASRRNLTGTFVLTREAARHMNNGGSIVTFSSMYGVVSPKPSTYPGDMPPNPIEYGAGKAGMIQMVRYMAAHFGPRNIRVNAVVPGPFPHPGVVDANPEFIGNLDRSTMLGRIGRQHETAGPTVFLLSEASSYITGQALMVDGGWTAW